MSLIVAASPYGLNLTADQRQLWVHFSDGFSLVADLEGLLSSDHSFSPLLETPAFLRLSVGPGGREVRWACGVSLKGEMLRLDNGHPDKLLETRTLSEPWQPLDLIPQLEGQPQHPVLEDLLAGGLAYARENYGTRNEWYAEVLFDLHELAGASAWRGRQWDFLERVALPVLSGVAGLGHIPQESASEEHLYLCSLCVGLPDGCWERFDDVRVESVAPQHLGEQAVGYLKREAVESLELRLKRQGRPYVFIAFEGYRSAPEVGPGNGTFAGVSPWPLSN